MFSQYKDSFWLRMWLDCMCPGSNISRFFAGCAFSVFASLLFFFACYRHTKTSVSGLFLVIRRLTENLVSNWPSESPNLEQPQYLYGVEFCGVPDACL